MAGKVKKQYELGLNSMHIEHFVLSEIEKGARQIKVPADINARSVVNSLILKGLIKNKVTNITVLQNGALLNHYKITPNGLIWLAQQGELDEDR